MFEALTIIAVTAGAYIGTNLDNLILLVALYQRYEKRPGVVTAGYFAGMLLIGVICLVIGEAGELIPVSYLGLLGVIPISIGGLALVQMFGESKSSDSAGVTPVSSANTIFSTVLMTQLSNSADSIITFSVLLADSMDKSDYFIAPTFLAMVGVFAWLAFYALKHPRLSEFLSRYGNYVTPFILILVGIYILSNTATDLMPG